MHSNKAVSVNLHVKYRRQAINYYEVSYKIHRESTDWITTTVKSLLKVTEFVKNSNEFGNTSAEIL